MIKRSFLLMVVVSCLALLLGCDRRSEREIHRRTVLVYMISSTLGTWLEGNLNDMDSAIADGYLGDGHLIVFYSYNRDSAKLFEMELSADGTVSRTLLNTFTNLSAIDPANMHNIIQTVYMRYPSASSGLILSSHGRAWLPADDSWRTAVVSERSFGEENRKWMEIYDLASALPDGFFDFIIFDACSMASIECVYELRTKADYIIASPSETLTNGFPYREILPHLFATELDVDKIAKGFYDFYASYRYPYGNISVTHTAGLEELALATREIIRSVQSVDPSSLVYDTPLPDWQLLSQWQGSPTRLFDFGDFITRLSTDTQSLSESESQPHPVSESQFLRFTTALNATISGAYATPRIYCSERTQYVPVTRYSGLSVYPLQSSLPALNEWYRCLEWYKAVYE